MDRAITRRMRLTWFGALVLLLSSWAIPAYADVAGPGRTEYLISVDGATVKIFLKDDYGAYDNPCNKAQPESYSVLRENVATKEVSLLPLYCDKDTNKREYMADYCVPKGTYRYGLLTPLECGSDYHGTVTVTADSTGCVDPRKVPSKKHTKAVPWEGASTTIPCAEETGCSVITGGSGAAQVAAGVLLLLLVVLTRRRS